MHTLVVYTVLTGHYSDLYNPFLPEWKGFEKICFTDNPSIASNGWRLIKLDDHFLDPTRAARRPKLLPHLYLPEFEYSLYIDTTVKLRMNPLDIIRLHANQKVHFWCFRHPWRNCIYEEAEEVISLGYDDERRVREQMDHYARLGYPKNKGLIACGILLRKHNDPAVIQLDEIWFEHILRFSKRDQLSFNFVAWQLNFEYGLFDGELTDNQFISWPGFPDQSRIPADFNEFAYEWLNPEISRTGMSPRLHYRMIGEKKGLPYKTKKCELDRLANKFKSDKGSIYFNAHSYAYIYEHYFAPIKEKPIRLLELGLLRNDIQARNPKGPYNDAPSLFMWREYFTNPNIEIIGFDIADFSELQLPKGCKIIRGNAGNPKDLISLGKSFDGGFDIIIDDASHASHHQQIAIANLFPFLKKGGYYIIEDLHYQPPHLELSGVTKTKTLLEMLRFGGHPKSQFITMEQMNYLIKNIAMIEFYDSFDRNFRTINSDALAVIKKH